MFSLGRKAEWPTFWGHRTTSLMDPFAWKVCVGVESEGGQKGAVLSGDINAKRTMHKPESTQL